MGLTLKRKEGIQKAFRRLARAHVEKALHQLLQPERMTAVHEVRKTIKRTRAFVRLFRPVLPTSDYRRSAKCLRAAATLLGAARDARVKMDALESLLKSSGHKSTKSEFASARVALSERSRKEDKAIRAEKTFSQVRKRLVRARRLLADSRVQGSSWTALYPGLKHSYRDGQRALARVKKTPTGECFHEFRKRVKDLYYQAGLLKKIEPGFMAPLQRTLERLGECLGKDHDLVLVMQSAPQVAGISPKDLNALRHAISTRQRELRRQALELASAFYKTKPAAFCKQLEGRWHNWRKGAG